jgi:hypothetical protein
MRSRQLATLRRRPQVRHAIAAAEQGPAEVDPKLYPALIRHLAADCDSVLDVGTGPMGLLASLPCRVKLGLDAHRPYLEHRETSDAIPIHASALELESLFLADSVELVTLLDVIEHFERDVALEVITQSERIASRRVLLFTPRGFFPQEGIDLHGLGGEEYQRHRSGWEVDDLASLGYRILILSGMHGEENPAFRHAFPEGGPRRDALLAWRHPPGEGEKR